MPISAASVGANVAMLITPASRLAADRPAASANSAVKIGSSIANSEPNAMNSTIAANTIAISSLAPPPSCCWDCWMPLPPSSTCSPSPSMVCAVSISFVYADLGMSCGSLSRLTSANAIVPSLLIWLALAFSYGLLTSTTCGSFATFSSIAVTRAWTPASLTSPARHTICAVSPDCVGDDALSRFSARVDSVPGSVNESLYLLPAAATRPAEYDHAYQPEADDDEAAAV